MLSLMRVLVRSATMPLLGVRSEEANAAARRTVQLSGIRTTGIDGR